MNDEIFKRQIFGAILVAFIAGIVFGYQMDRSFRIRSAVKAGVGEYNSTSGVFQWKTNFVEK